MPADGVIVAGTAEVDESMITGESRPVVKEPGDRVVAGTVATDSSIRVRVDAVGDDTALAGIQRLVADAQASRSRAQVLADRFAALLFYVATAAGLITFVVWSALGDTDNAIVRSVTVLVIACPHALGLAIPLVVSLSTAVSARAGILVKDRLALERMRSIDTVLFDKTGTLTKGAHVVTGVAAAGGLDECERAPPRRRRRVRQRAPARPGDRRRRPRRAARSRPADEFRAFTGRGVEADRSTGSATPSVARPCCASVTSTPPAALADPIAAWEQRGAAVLYLIRGTTTTSSARSPSRTRCGPRPGRPSPTFAGWAWRWR